MTTNNDWETLEFVEVDTSSNALSWKPSHDGDYIIGEYIRTEQGTGKGEGLLFHHLKDKDGIEYSILGCAVLNRNMEAIQPGDITKITYKGKAKTKNGREYNNYSVGYVRKD